MAKAAAASAHTASREEAPEPVHTFQSAEQKHVVEAVLGLKEKPAEATHTAPVAVDGYVYSPKPAQAAAPETSQLHAAGEDGVFAVGLLTAAPARIAEDVQDQHEQTRDAHDAETCPGRWVAFLCPDCTACKMQRLLRT
jgi:hypothetical protein